MMNMNVLFISLSAKKRTKETALYKLLISFAACWKRGEKFFRFIPYSIMRLRRTLNKGDDVKRHAYVAGATK